MVWLGARTGNNGLIHFQLKAASLLSKREAAFLMNDCKSGGRDLLQHKRFHS